MKDFMRHRSESAPGADQFVSVASIVRELLPKVTALREKLFDDLNLEHRYVRKVASHGHGADTLCSAYHRLQRLELQLGRLREEGG